VVAVFPVGLVYHRVVPRAGVVRLKRQMVVGDSLLLFLQLFTFLGEASQTSHDKMKDMHRHKSVNESPGERKDHLLT